MTHPADSTDPLLPGHTPPLPASDPELEAQLDAAILRELACKPTPVIPERFAERVTSDILKPDSERSIPPVGWGPRLALASAALLTAGLFALAPHAVPSFGNLAFDGELVLLAELCALLLFAGRLLI